MAHRKCTLPGQGAVAKTSHRGNDVVFRYDIDEFRTTLCVNSGKVEFRTWVEGDKHMDVQLYGCDCWTYHWWSGLFNADSMRVATTILSASANYFLTVKWNH